MRRIIAKAGHEVWPRLLQNLRASCATDWVERYPAHVVAKWLGHSPKVAAAHSLQAREHHFEDVVAGGAAGQTNSADSSALTAAQQVPAGFGREGIAVPRQEASQKQPAGAMGHTVGLPGWRPGVRAKNSPPWPWGTP